MASIIASCGIDCTKCDAYIATMANDDAARGRIAEKWGKEYNFAFKPGDINCHGCHATDGVQIGHCAQCGIRKCAFGMGYKTCAECADLDTCAQLAAFISQIPGARDNLKALRE